jgi:delta 1-pyrroline-5-carboxylate dehydrogenase
MSPLEQRMNQLFQDYRPTLGGRLEDYFGAAYLEIQHRLAADTALAQTVRGNNDYGIDAYTLDRANGNLYLYQFKYSTDWRQFQDSMRRLVKAGLAKVFSSTPLDVLENPALQLLRAEIDEFKPTIRGGEERPEGLDRGYFVKPTVFANVRNEMTIAKEEIFGPVLSILTYSDEEEAIRLANASDYGLHAYVFSSNVPRANAVAARLEAGRVMVNTLQNDALAPFGGYKQSGFGREFGLLGLESFLEPKAIIGE